MRAFVSKYLYWPSRLLAETALFNLVALALKLHFVRSRISSKASDRTSISNFEVGAIDNFLALWLTKRMCYAGRDVRAAWPVVGTPYTNRERYRPWARWAHQHLTMYRFFLDQVPPQSKVLDLGGGIGNMAANLAVMRSDIHMTVIDLDRLSVRIGSSLFQEVSNLEFINQDARSQLFLSSFDHCFMIELLEHVPAESHIDLIRTALAALKPNGKLFVTTPNAVDQEDEPWGHIGLLNLQRAKKLVEVFEGQISKFGYLRSDELTTNDPNAYSISDEIKNIGYTRADYSHYYFEFTNQ